MARRALLIGSQTYELAGCDADVELMRTVLSARGFDPIDVRTAQDATRAGIVDAFEQLIAAISPSDAVVIFYSGHGGRLTLPDHEERKAAGRSVHAQFLVPFDLDQSEEDDFRGLLSEEVTAFQRRITDAFRNRGATPNVTTVLDCCHSGYMARDASLRPKAVDLPKSFPTRGVQTRAKALKAHEGVVTNPDVVRVVACQAEQSAFERASERGPQHGVLTDALATVLEALGTDDVSWSIVGDRLRQRVSVLVPQRPEIEGPASRLLFSPDRDHDCGSFAVTSRNSALVIEAAHVLGVSVGDTFHLERPDGRKLVASAKVTSLESGDAILKVSPARVIDDLPATVRAVPKRMSAGKRRVAVDFAGPGAAPLRKAVGKSPRLTVDAETGPVFAHVIDDGGLVVLDELRARTRVEANPNDKPGRQRTVELLETLALGRRLRDLPSGEGTAQLDAEVEVVFATVHDGKLKERRRFGDHLVVGDHISLILRNLSDIPLFFWVFDVGVSGRASLVTNAAPSGTTLEPKRSPGDTCVVWGADGGKLAWPPDVPIEPTPSVQTTERQESLIIILADARQDLSNLETPTRGEPEKRALSALDEMLAEVRTGVREAPSQQAPGRNPLRYRVEQIEFLLAPTR